MTDELADMPKYTQQNAERAKQNVCDLCNNAPTEEIRQQCRDGAGC